MLRFQDMEDSDGLPPLREASSTKTEKLPRLGRIFGLLFAAEPRELDRALKQDKPGTVGKAALALIQHVKDRISSGLSLEQAFVPILEHAVKSKETSYRKRSVILLRWLLQSQDVGVAIASALETVLGATPWNNRVRLGWCVLIRELVQVWLDQGGMDTPLHSKTLDIFVTCIPQLVNIVLVASVKEGKRRVPTRLTIAAADCLLTITNTLAAGPPAQPDVSQEKNLGGTEQKRSLITPIDSDTDYERSGWLGADSDMDNVPSTSKSDLFSNTKRRELALWEQLDHLILLLRALEEWNDRDRALFTKGLQCVHRRLQLLANYRDSVQSKEGGGESDLSVGAAVLAACWQHYGGLILMEDKKLSAHPEPILQHWLGALQVISATKDHESNILLSSERIVSEEETPKSNIESLIASHPLLSFCMMAKQYYLQQTEESDTDEEKRKTMEMRGYALACLTLVLGRMDARRLDTTLQDLGPELLKALFDQLRGADDSIVDLSVAILRAVLFRPSSSSTSGGSVAAVQMETVVPMLLEMLDTRDIASRAVVLLVAEFFAVNPESIEMEQLFSRLDSEESGHRRNALDVLTELLSICTRSVDMVNSSLSQTIAKHLFKRLGDIELSNRVEASALFAKLDSSFTLPTLLEFLYSPDGRIRSAASTAILSVLKGQTNQSKVVTELLDFATKMVKPSLPGQDLQPGAVASRGRKPDGPLDLDRIMRLLPDWAATVEEWENVIHVVLSKMFREPANAVIPRFLSSISIQLGDRVHVLFPLILEEMRGQPKLTEDYLSELSKEDSTTSEGGALGKELFQRLSSLLVLRVLPLSAFNDRTCKELYGARSSLEAGAGALHTGCEECITGLLIDRVCGGFEFEDVRKIAAELTGRLLPDIMIPMVTAQLDDATRSQDLFSAKACIYVLCTSLGIRGQEALNHPLMSHICQLLTSILLWRWAQEDAGYSEVGKVQHGCIDCFAMMICAEFQPRTVVPALEEAPVEPSAESSQTEVVNDLPELEEVETSPLSPKIKFIEELPESEQLRSHDYVGGGQNKLVEEFSAPGLSHTRLSPVGSRPKLIEEISDSKVVQEIDSRGDQPSSSHPSIFAPVLTCLITQQQRLPWLTETASAPRAFRVCMANVLISVCQKVALGARTTLASRMILPLVNFVQVSADSKLRGACLQVLFTAVYHLKTSSVLPYAVNLFDLSIAAIKSKDLLEERIGGAKLLASLLGSEEALVRDLAPRLIDAQFALTNISAMDSSPELRQICEKLLSCLSTPGETL